MMEYLKIWRGNYIVFFIFCALNIVASRKVDHPTVVTVHDGQTAVLPCDFKYPEPNPPPCVIEWIRQGQQLPVYIKIAKYSPHIDPKYGGRMSVNPGEASLTIERVGEGDEGWYECRVIFLKEEKKNKTVVELSKGREKHAPFLNGTWVKLVVTAPPAFKYVPPSSVTSREGEVLLFRCRAVGRPKPIITWYKDGWPIKNGQDGIRISDGELAVTSLQKFHKGEYTCRAQNVEGQIEHTTTVYIQGAPVYISPPQNTTVKEGEDAMFSCRAEGYPTSIRYSWLYNGEPVASADRVRGRHSDNGDGNLMIYNVVAEDRGTVSCRANNGYGSTPIATATLVVEYPARVTQMPSIRYAGLGLRTVLPCPASAVPAVSTVTWRKDNRVIRPSQEGRYSLGENGSLVIENVEQKDAGRYTCIPYNILGTLGESTGTRLIIRYPPYFTIPPQAHNEAVIGNDLVIPCQGSGDPPPHISWVKIGENSEETELENAEGRVTWEEGNLTISSVIKSDHGAWECVLSNAVASVRSNVMIFVKYTTPHAVANITVVTSMHSAQITWDPGYDGGYPQHFMIWYKRADLGDHSWLTHSVESYRKAATVSNLEPDTIYQFALLPENVLGSGQFSKTVIAKTKELPPPGPTLEPETVPAPNRIESHVEKDSGLLMLMWQPPLDGKKEDLLGYLLEFRMLLVDENKSIDEDSSDIPEDTTNQDAPQHISKRSITFIRRIIAQRQRRDVATPTEASNTEATLSNDSWSAWRTLATVLPNETTYDVQPDDIYRDQLYEFHVLAVSKSAYSSPSMPITISTKGLTAYPIMVKSDPSSLASSAGNPGILAGIVTASLFLIMVIILTTLWCYHRKRGKDALSPAAFTFGRVQDERFDPRSRTKSENSQTSLDSKSPRKVREEKNGPLAKLKKKMLKVDIDLGHTYSSTDELVGMNRKISESKQTTTEQPQTDKQSQTLIRKINRASDGKFHMSDNSSVDAAASDGLSNRQGNISKSPSRVSRKSDESRSHSVEWDPRAPLLPPGVAAKQHATPDSADALEIDCSHSDIEVRYFKGQSRGWQSNSSSSLAGPRQYNLIRRQTEPYCSPMNSSANTSYPTTSDYQQALAPYTRPSVASPTYSTVSPYAQYVHFRDLGPVRPDGTPRERHPEYRVSSPPRFSDYNPTPSSPPKYRYHKHVDQPGGHYHVSPRESYSNAADRLVFDPRYTPIGPIYEVGPYSPSHPANRHSSFVVESRHNPASAQQYRTENQPMNTHSEEGTTYPTPVWHAHQNAPFYHTVPHPPSKTNARMHQSSSDPESIEASLRRHSANAVSGHTPRNAKDFSGIEHSLNSPNNNTLGRTRRLTSAEEDSGSRRRVCSVDDLTRDSALVSSSSNFTERAGSVDLLSPRKTKHSNVASNSSTFNEDRKLDGCNHSDDDVCTTSSSSNSDKLPRGVVTSRTADLRSGKPTIDDDNPCSPHQVLIHSPTSPNDDSSAVSSSLMTPRDNIITEGQHLEGASSGYDSRNTSHTSDSPPPLSPNVQQSSCHDRTSTASSSDRSRKDNSSVDEKYEWDSEFAMESEILEALRHFGTHRGTGSISRALMHEIQKLGVDKLHELGEMGCDLENLEKVFMESDDTISSEESNKSLTVDTSDMYTKESMERRCAALKKEYQRYQRDQQSNIQQASPGVFTHADGDNTILSTHNNA